MSLLAGTKETVRWSSRIQEGVTRVCATGKKTRREKVQAMRVKPDID